MADFYLLILVSICIGILVWSVVRIERVYQFPFFMVSIFLSFILPQAIAIADSSDQLISESAVNRVLLHSCLCVLMCLVGYQFLPNRRFVQYLHRINGFVDEGKLMQASIFLLVFGWICYYAAFNLVE